MAALRNSDHVVVSVSIDFKLNSKGDVPCEDIFKLRASAADSEFCEWVQVLTDVYILHRKYRLHDLQLPVLLPWLIEITFFVCTNRVNLLNLKSSSDRLVIVAKEFLKLPNSNMLIKQSTTSQKTESWDFRRIAKSVLNKGKSVTLLYSAARRCCLLHLIKQNRLLKTFLWTVILMNHVSLYLPSLLELI